MCDPHEKYPLISGSSNSIRHWDLGLIGDVGAQGSLIDRRQLLCPAFFSQQIVTLSTYVWSYAYG